MQPESRWTPVEVADAIVRAYRRVHGAPVATRAGGRIDMAAGDVEAMSWPDRHVRDPVDRRILRMWGRCSATGESIRDYCRNVQLPPSRFRRRKIAAIDEIAAALNHAAPAGRESV